MKRGDLVMAIKNSKWNDMPMKIISDVVNTKSQVIMCEHLEHGHGGFYVDSLALVTDEKIIKSYYKLKELYLKLDKVRLKNQKICYDNF